MVVAMSSLALLLLSAVGALGDTDKRAELSPAPFVLGSRYGRSPPRLLTPRNDRFFMGSRYGKRSDVEPPFAPLSEPAPEPLSSVVGRGPGAPPPPPPPLLCDYTGLSSLFHCRIAHTHRHLDYRSTEEDPRSPEED